jgi:hypothetical protein
MAMQGRSGKLSDGHLFDKIARRGGDVVVRFEIQRDGFANVPPSLIEGIAFGNTSWQGRNVGRVAAFVRVFEMNFVEHRKTIFQWVQLGDTRVCRTEAVFINGYGHRQSPAVDRHPRALSNDNVEAESLSKGTPLPRT